MTLNGRKVYSVSCRKDTLFGAHQKNLNKDRYMLSAAKIAISEIVGFLHSYSIRILGAFRCSRWSADRPFGASPSQNLKLLLAIK